jgi:hypothetical protein
MEDQNPRDLISCLAPEWNLTLEVVLEAEEVNAQEILMLRRKMKWNARDKWKWDGAIDVVSDPSLVSLRILWSPSKRTRLIEKQFILKLVVSWTATEWRSYSINLFVSQANSPENLPISSYSLLRPPTMRARSSTKCLRSNLSLWSRPQS